MRGSSIANAGWSCVRGLLLSQGRGFGGPTSPTTAPKASNLLCGQRLILCFGEPMAGWLSGLHRPADFRRTRGVRWANLNCTRIIMGAFVGN